MEPEAKYTLVGVVVVVLVALLTAAVVWLRSSGEGPDARRYKIYFEHQSLEGLEPRSHVTVRGVRVGSVTSFRFSERRPGAVEVLIAVDPAAPVREVTQATVERHLVTGLATVQLSNANEESPLLSRAPPGEPYPVIVEGESSITQVSESLTRLTQQASSAMQRFSDVLSPANQEAITETLENLRQVSRRADSTLARADDALGSVGRAADEVHALAGSVAADARRLTARFDTLGSQASGSVRELSEATRRISADVQRLTQRADGLLASSEEEVRATGRALRSAADSVGAAAGRLRDPRQIMFGPAESGLGPGENSR